MHLLTFVTLLGLTWLPGDSGQGLVTKRGRCQQELPLSLRIQSPRTVRRGEPVPIDLVLTNEGRHEVIASLDRSLADSQPAFALIITRLGGAPVWRRPPDPGLPVTKDVHGSRPRAAASGVQVDVRLGPGASYRLRERWRQEDVNGRRVSAGTYVIQGSILVADRLLLAEARAIRIY
jgi:hypothetical protein